MDWQPEKFKYVEQIDRDDMSSIQQEMLTKKSLRKPVKQKPENSSRQYNLTALFQQRIHIADDKFNKWLPITSLYE